MGDWISDGDIDDLLVAMATAMTKLCFKGYFINYDASTMLLYKLYIL